MHCHIFDVEMTNWNLRFLEILLVNKSHNILLKNRLVYWVQTFTSIIRFLIKSFHCCKPVSIKQSLSCFPSCFCLHSCWRTTVVLGSENYDNSILEHVSMTTKKFGQNRTR